MIASAYIYPSLTHGLSRLIDRQTQHFKAIIRQRALHCGTAYLSVAAINTSQKALGHKRTMASATLVILVVKATPFLLTNDSEIVGLIGFNCLKHRRLL
jgi:hypothetical protein